ncbi:MAG: cytochrome P460 family protein [Candidatus Methanoperedens sp.]|nr:cytochrome P460 family protein [Candidatus Methanoperedens sp.]MCZ7395987.1 cytochrome P460 family protein [Candidatus Methanoperedens sp.]
MADGYLKEEMNNMLKKSNRVKGIISSIAIVLFIIISGCVSTHPQVMPATSTATPAQGPAPKIDRVGFPEDYQTNFKLFYVFDIKEHKRVLVVYANDNASSIKLGQPFPYGSILAMETYSARQDAQGNVLTDANGHYLRDQLQGIIVMRKEIGFGVDYQNLRNDEWEYVAYRPNKTYLVPPQNTSACAGCHLAAIYKDFVFRGNLYFVPGKYGASPIAGPNEVFISSMGFSPATLQVKTGTTIRWTNYDVIAHSVVANDQSFVSAVLNPGDSFNLTFSKAGTFEYVCGVHPQLMKAQIEVKE